jgi:hypothetical protein
VEFNARLRRERWLVKAWGVLWRFRILLVVLFVPACHGLVGGVLPAVEGDVSGELKLFPQSPDIALPWKITLKPAPDGGQAFALVVDAAGTRLQAEGRVDLATGDGSWKIDAAQVDATAWFAACALKFAPQLTGMVAQGIVTITGTGTLNNGRPTGHIKIEWRDGSLRQEAQGWALDRIAFDGEFAVDGTQMNFHSTSPFELTIGLVTSSRFGARNVFMSGLFNKRPGLAVTAARVEIAGGEVSVDPCEVLLSPPVVDAKLRIRSVGLQDIVYLIPTAGLAEARGRIDGDVQVKWSSVAGFRLGLGQLGLRADEPTIVRLSAAPGILTGHVPQRIDLLPPWLGPLARWVRPINPAYENMHSIELGQSELRVKTLDVQLTPDGDDQGRSATVRLVAQPVQSGSSVKEVTFDVNVAGPIADVVKLGLERGFTLGAH